MPRKPEYDRDDLIDRARTLFWRKGWAGSSLKDLEDKLKINPGSFYAAFGSKDALFELTLDRYATDGV
ncbi:MAG: helix-turn-helix domain-containing protein, partial [Pseudomonadota bacterium]